jgi:hypothetical protein
MKKYRLVVFIILVLAVIAIILLVTNSKSTFSSSVRDFAVKDTASITKIFMSDKANNELLLKKVNGVWNLNDAFKVRKDAINIFLKTVYSVAVLEPVSKSLYNSVIKQLAANSVKVEIYQYKHRINIFNLIKLFPREKLSKTYYVGGSTQNNMGTFMLMEGSDTPFITYIPGFRGFISIRYSPREDDWRDHTIFNQRLTDIKSVRLEFNENPDQSYIARNNENSSVELISLSQNRNIPVFDTLRLLDFLTSFDNIKFEALLNNLNIENKDSILNSVPLHVITLTDKTGKEFVVKTFHKYPAEEEFDIDGNPVLYDRDRMYALVNEDKDFVLIQYFVFDKILRPLGYFMK